MRRHLDLGCGTQPRNPFACEQVFGIDIRSGLIAPGVVEIVPANLSLQPIPFPDNHFDSLSAYDFLEHVPRVTLDGHQGHCRFPFIELMNEVWRVLKPGGIFYAVFPAFPHSLAFCDPTHVNILTSKSHRYFTGPEPMAQMYGFEGRFDLLRQQRIHPRAAYHPQVPSIQLRAKMLVDRLMGRRSHLIWELRAVK
ncbi:MAG: class I SAM-dependent methyltransferase [Burkholderiaceae bacterium]